MLLKWGLPADSHEATENWEEDKKKNADKLIIESNYILIIITKYNQIQSNYVLLMIILYHTIACQPKTSFTCRVCVYGELG